MVLWPSDLRQHHIWFAFGQLRGARARRHGRYAVKMACSFTIETTETRRLICAHRRWRCRTARENGDARGELTNVINDNKVGSRSAPALSTRSSSSQQSMGKLPLDGYFSGRAGDARRFRHLAANSALAYDSRKPQDLHRKVPTGTAAPENVVPFQKDFCGCPSAQRSTYWPRMVTSTREPRTIPPLHFGQTFVDWLILDPFLLWFRRAGHSP